MARDSYSFLHFPMVAGVVLIALGLKKTIAHVDEPLDPETAFALVGGLAIYLLAHIAFRLAQRPLDQQAAPGARGRAAARSSRSPTSPTPSSPSRSSTVAMVALITYEAIHFAEARDQIRHQVSA